MDQIKTSPEGAIISYDAWKNYWEPMDAQFTKLKEDYSQLQKDKSVTVRLEMRTHYLEQETNFKRYMTIGVISPCIDIGGHISFEIHAPELSDYVRSMIESDIQSKNYQRLYSVQDIEQWIDSHNKTIRSLNTEKQEYIKLIETYYEFIMRLPWLIKWLFRLNKKIKQYRSTCK